MTSCWFSLLTDLIRMDCIPRWRGLSHFKKEAIKTSFTDGKKMADLSKV